MFICESVEGRSEEVGDSLSSRHFRPLVSIFVSIEVAMDRQYVEISTEAVTDRQSVDITNDLVCLYVSRVE